ncbi:kelch-like protein 2 isoform X6, partial [Aphis craccivora]
WVFFFWVFFPWPFFPPPGHQWLKCHTGVGVGELDGVPNVCSIAVGGYNNNGKSLKSLEVYRPCSRVWSFIADLHFLRNNPISSTVKLALSPYTYLKQVLHSANILQVISKNLQVYNKEVIWGGTKEELTSRSPYLLSETFENGPRGPTEERKGRMLQGRCITNVVACERAVVTVSTAGGGVAMAVLYSSSSRLCAPFDLEDGGRSRQECVYDDESRRYIYHGRGGGGDRGKADGD